MKVLDRNGLIKLINSFKQLFATKKELNEIKTIPTILFYDTNGSTGNIALSQKASDFNFIEIFYTQYQGYQDSVKIDLSINNKASLTASIYDGDGIYFDTKTVTINDNTINVDSCGILYYLTGIAKGKNNNIKIRKVIGYK